LENLKHTGYYYGALLFAFLIPFHPKLSTLALVLWLLLSLISFSQKTLVRNKTLLLLPIAYVAYFICFFTAETPKFRFLETKLSLLVFPLIFFLNVYSVRQRGKILKFLVFGLVVSSILCLIVAFYNSIGIENGNLYFRANVLEGKGFMDSILYGGNYFFGRYLSIFHQTVYYAMYLCAGVAVLLFVPKLFTTKLRTSLLGIFLFFIFLVSNKASFIALALILILKLHTWNVNRSKKAIGVSLFAMVLTAVVFLNPRIKESVVNIVEGKMTLNKEARYGFATRLLSWDAAVSLIKEKPVFGYGHAVTQEALNKKYQEEGYIFPLKESYNAHNLWLQSWLENGLFAIIILLGIFLVLFQKSWHKPLFLAFVLILLTNSLFEGMFNRFSGIIFFSFLVCFIFSASKGGLAKT
jgi:O-antigen ligase